MKNILYILILLTLMGCRKTETFVVHGNVKHKFTNDKISGIYITIGSPGSPGTSNGTTYCTTHTDNDGNYFFNFDLKIGNKFKGDFVIQASIPDGDYDSTKSNFKYYYEYIKVNESEFNNSQDFLLTPSGVISFHASDNTWDIINTDSILIQSPFESKYLVRQVSPDNKIYFQVDPSVVSTFNYCYIKNGIQSTFITKNIFVPNLWTFVNNGSNNTSIYEIYF